MAPYAVWKQRALLAGLLSLIIFTSLLPLGPMFGGIPGPYLAMCLLFAFVLRRPDYVPLGLVLVMVFAADALLMRPLGLWTLIMLVATEFLRRSVVQTEALTPEEEFGQILPVMLACFIAERLILLALLAEPPVFFSQVIHVGMTLVFYPIIVLFTHSVLGVRRLQPGEVDTLGGRA